MNDSTPEPDSPARPSAANTRLVDAPLASPRGLGAAWILPIGAALLAGWLGWRALSGRGAVIDVRFEEGHGLETGADVRFRGAAIGSVEDVVLLGDASGVRARLRLRPEAASLARSGTRWWIARPRISLAGIDGLDTIVGARYIALEPGPSGGTSLREFEGLAEAPVNVPWVDGLEIVLEADTRGGLAAGAPVVHRQFAVGVVLSVGLASDGSSVLVRASIDPNYAGLVREDSRFWNASGVRFEAGLVRGVRVSVDSLEALATGAVAFATPTAAGAPAKTGARFDLAAEPKDEWLTWVPRLPVGYDGTLALGTRPTPVRAALRWKRFVIGTTKRTNGWCLRLEDAWLGPTGLLQVPDGIDAAGAQLEVDGTVVSALPHGSSSQNVVTVAQPFDQRGWRRADIRVPLEPENCLVFGDPARGPAALDATRLTAADHARWNVSDPGAFDGDWHGAPVVARFDGKLIGILLVDDDGAHIAVDVPLAR